MILGKNGLLPKTHRNFASEILGKSWGKPPPIFRCKTTVTEPWLGRDLLHGSSAAQWRSAGFQRWLHAKSQNLEVVDVDMHNTKISEYRNEKCTLIHTVHIPRKYLPLVLDFCLNRN